MGRMILDIDGFNSLITHIQELNYEVREVPLDGDGIVLNEIVSEDGVVVGTFKTYEGGIPFALEERETLRAAIEELEQSGDEITLDKLRKVFPNLFDAPKPMLIKNVCRATRVADLIASYPDGGDNNADDVLKDSEVNVAADVITDCCHLAQYAVVHDKSEVLEEDRKWLNEFVTVRIDDRTVAVPTCVAMMLYTALNNYASERRGEE